MMRNTHNKKLPGVILLIAGVLLLCAGIVQARQEPKLDLKTTVEKEVKVKKQGKQVLERRTVDKTAPGDVLVYTIAYANTGGGDMVDAVIVNPVPNGVRLNPESVKGMDAEVTCSIDNNRSYHPPPVLVKIKKADGSLESRPAELDRYTHIRWLIKKTLHPGQSGQVSFKAIVK
jgi:uncharacterized repeat protein (TIGR01451 family)